MAQLIVLGFDTEDEAGKILGSVRAGQKDGLLALQDSAVITKDADGKVHVKNQ